MKRHTRIVATLASLALTMSVAAPAAAADEPPLEDGMIGYDGHYEPELSVTGTFETAAAATPTPACPSSIETAEFGDVPGASTHARAIDCLAWWGVSLGDGNYGYGPGKPVTRAQNASFLARALDSTSRPLPPEGALPLPPGVGLPDVVHGAPHSDQIVRVVTAGVMRARSDGSFRGGVPLRRDEMAVAIVSAYDYADIEGSGRGTTSTVSGRFPDLDGHRDAPIIERAYELGFTSGLADGTFDPAGEVNRAQMASFLTRLLDRLVTDYYAYPPERPAWRATPPGRKPAAPLKGEGTTFVFYDKNQDGTPVRWDPCETIPVYVNYKDAPTGAKTAVERAIKMVRDASGLDVRVAGTSTDHIPNDGFVPHVDGRLTIGWASYGYRSLIGYGGPMPNWPDWNDPNPTLRVVSGGVAMNSDWTGTGDNLVLGLMHEIGHALGLDHAPDPAQVMHYGLTFGRKVAWGDGDLAALRVLGDKSGCA